MQPKRNRRFSCSTGEGGVEGGNKPNTISSGCAHGGFLNQAPSAYQPTERPTDPPAHQPTHLPTRSPTHAPTHPLTHPPTHPPIHENESVWMSAALAPLLQKLASYFCYKNKKAGTKHTRETKHPSVKKTTQTYTTPVERNADCKCRILPRPLSQPPPPHAECVAATNVSSATPAPPPPALASLLHAVRVAAAS